MEVYLRAWAVFVALCAGIALSFWAFNRDRHRVCLLLIIGVGFLLRWYAGSYRGLFPWDERYHALVARNLCFDPLTPTLYRTPVLDYDFRDWQANHVWLHKPPLALWLMAASIAVLGATEAAVRLPSLLLGTLCIPLTYSLGKRLWSEKVGLTAALFHAVSPQLIRLATGQQSVDHVDTALVFFIESAVWLAVVHRDRPRTGLVVVIGLVTGLALLTKWLPGLLVCPVFLLLVRGRLGWRRAALQTAAVALLAGVVSLPWTIYCRARFPQEYACEQGIHWQHIFEAVHGQGGPPFYHLRPLLETYGALVWLPLAWLVIVTFRRGGSARWAVLAWWGFPLVLFSLIATKRANYLAIAAPAIFLTLAYQWWTWHTSFAQRRQPRTYAVVLALLMLLPLIPWVALASPFRAATRAPAWAAQLRALGPRLASENAVVLNAAGPIETMFYTGATAYPSVPPRDQVADLMQRGYRVYVFDSPDVPADVRDLPDVTLIPPLKDYRPLPAPGSDAQPFHGAG
jgi:4-amino-4-deoxy-L-arabinose transferase